MPYDLLAEFLPSSHRGAFLIYVEYFWTFGSLFVAAVAWRILPLFGWRALTFITVVPVAISSIFSLTLLPESPRWLLLQGRTEEAEEVMRSAATIGGSSLPPFTLFEPKKESPSGQEHPLSMFSNDWFLSFFQEYNALLKTTELRCVSIPLWFVWLSFGFSYYGIILLISRIYSTNNTSSSVSSSTSSFDFSSIFLSAASELVGVFITSLIVDRWGRVPTQSTMYLCTGLAMLVLGLLRVPFFSSGPIVLASLTFLARLCAMSSSSATWVATPELYSTVSACLAAMCMHVQYFFVLFLLHIRVHCSFRVLFFV